MKVLTEAKIRDISCRMILDDNKLVKLQYCVPNTGGILGATAPTWKEEAARDGLMIASDVGMLKDFISIVKKSIEALEKKE